MANSTQTSFIQSLRDFQLLTPVQLDELPPLQTRFSDAGALARELVRRGWLTAYQADLLAKGQGKDLVLGPYRLLDRLGEGAMGQVFKARHLRMQRVVALKIIRKERLAGAHAVQRFEQEVRAAAQLSHPNIVLAHDADEVDGTHFLAMEYVEGIDLAKLVQQAGPLPVAQASDFIRQAALGLQHAHEKGLIHRDIKPGNLLVTRANPQSSSTVKILDFGLARLQSESSGSGRLTKLGSIVGTVDYISPEQAENPREADIRSDIYSLGCSLFYLLTGRAPFLGEDMVERLSGRLLGDAPPVRSVRPEVPPGLEQVLGKMLAREPAKRFQTPVEVAGALESFGKAGKDKQATPDSVSGKTVAGDEGSGMSMAGNKGSSTGARSPLASLEDEERTTFNRSSPVLGLAKPKAKAAGNKGLMLALAIGGGAAAILAVVLVIVLSSGRVAGKKNSGAIVNNDDGKTKKAKDQNPARDNRRDTGKKNNKKDGHKKVDEPPPKDGPKVGSKDPPKNFTIRGLGMKFVLVGKGTARLGGGGGMPGTREVPIPHDFYLGVYEVTQEEWEKVMGSNPSIIKAAGGVPKEDQKRLPVENVTWYDTQEFIKLFNEKVKEMGWTYRLPKADEWEYACRGGPLADKLDSSFAFYFDKPTNQLLPAQANFNKVLGRTCKVGSYKPNRLGLYDMHGNVWEWCDDTDNAVERGSRRVRVGGSWDFDRNACQAAHRYAAPRSDKSSNLGFRLARVPVGHNGN